jgi:parallel beta-helix repeat protein
LRFDGVNDYVDAGNSASLDVTGAITIMAWVNPSIAQEVCYPAVGENRGVAAKVDAASGSTRWSWQLRFGSPTNCALGFQFNDPVNGRRWVSVAQALTPGQWYHVTATFDGSTVRSYLNGVLKESATMSSIQSYPTTKVIIGADGWGDYFSGSVDDFRIYRRVLSAAEMNQVIASAGTTTTTSTTTTRTTSTTSTTSTTTTTTTRTTTTTTRTTTTTSTTTTQATTPTTPGNAVYVADYGVTGDGSDELAKLKNAISAAAASSSKTLVFPAGKTITTGGSIRFTRGLNIIGNGCTLLLKSGTSPGTLGGSGWMWIYAEPGVDISGLVIDGNRYNNGVNTHGVMLQGDNVFNNNVVKRVWSYSVVVYGDTPTNVYITNNQIIDSHQYGITTGCTDGPSCYGHNIVVTGNTITDCDQVGIKVRGTVGATIANNKITLGDHTGDTPSGIRLYTWDEANWDIVIRDNTIIGLDEADTTCIDSDDSQNYRITITGNTVSHCDTGIELQFTGGTITNNKVSNCNSCITGSSGNTVTNNICT